MHWIRAHRYTAALIAMAVLVVVGGVMATREKPAGTAGGTTVENISVPYPYYAPPTGESRAGTAAGENPQPWKVTASKPASSTVLFFGHPAQPEAPAAAETVPNLAPVPVTQQAPVKTADTSLNGAYLLFFQQLANILSPKDTRSPEQKALFDYGNTAGAIIKTFEDTHRGIPQTLKAFFDDHTAAAIAAGNATVPDAYAQLNANSAPAKSALTKEQLAANVQGVADEYAALSAEIQDIKDVPPAAEIANKKLAEGYAAVAKGLSGLTKAETDEQLLAAIDAYNATADAFIKNYVSIVDLFSAYGVKFGANDPGVVFSFGGGSTL